MSIPDDDDDEGLRHWLHPGDLGVILLAGVFLAGMLGAIFFIFSSPDPVSDLFGKKPAAQQQNVVDVTVPPKD